jgi:hypothetical protein
LRRTRWLWFFAALAAGVGLGLLYGWVISPVQYVDTTPDSLHADYRADSVLMVAEIYAAEGDLDAAARRLAFLGDTPPAEIAAQAAEYARAHAFPPGDQALLRRLEAALQTWSPAAPGER